MRSATTIPLLAGFLLLSLASLSGTGKDDAQKFKDLFQGEVRILKETR